MKQHKNAILILVAIVLIVYAILLSIYPGILKSSFDKNKFGEKVFEATSLVTTVDGIDYKVTPNLDMNITLYKWSSKYVDNQDCFDADRIDIVTNLFAPITKNFNLKSMTLKNVVFSNQLLIGQGHKANKLGFLPGAIEPAKFGKKKFTVTISGPVKVKKFTIKYIAPNFYNEKKRDFVEYSKQDVKTFLKDKPFNKVVIK